MPELFDLRYWRIARADITRSSQRAAMWAVRQSARQTGRAAKKLAPVYKGPARNVTVSGRKQPLIPGEYKRSIRSSKRLKRSGDSVGVAVGPRGEHVHLYAQKVERRFSPMGRAYAATAGQYRGIYESAMRRALMRYGRL